MASARQDDRVREQAKLERQSKELVSLTQALTGAGVARQRIEELAGSEAQITTGLRELNAAVKGRLTAKADKDAATADLATAHASFLEKLEPLVDDANFDLVMAGEKIAGRSEGAQPIDAEVEALRVLLALRAEANLAVGLLHEAAGVLDSNVLQPLRERFIASSGHIEGMLARLPDAARKQGVHELTQNLLAFGSGANSIFNTRSDELREAAVAEQALRTSGVLTVRLNEELAKLVSGAEAASGAAAVSAASTIQTGETLLLIITALSIAGVIFIALYYVVPRVVQPLENMTAAMTALAAGNTSVAIPGRDRRDEIGRMAKALAVFRDTAVEIEEKNLRDVAAAQQRLIDAIESSSEGFALFDAEDRLVLCNGHFRDFYQGLGDVIVPGTSFASIASAAAERTVLHDDTLTAEQWLARRSALHRTPAGPILQCHNDGRWIQINERKTQDRGTVAVYTDVTDIKRTEQALVAAQARLQYLLTFSPSIICSFQVEGGKAPTFISENVRELLGYEPSDYLAGPEFWLERIHPADYARVHVRVPKAPGNGSQRSRVSVPTSRRQLLLGAGRATSGPQRGWRTARGCRIVERYLSTQGGRTCAPPADGLSRASPGGRGSSKRSRYAGGSHAILHGPYLRPYPVACWPRLRSARGWHWRADLHEGVAPCGPGAFRAL